MSVIRQANLLGQMRVDVPHLRGLESSIAGDFDLLAGQMLAGKAPLVISGFKLIVVGAITADQLYMDVAGSSMIHYFASESGSIFNVPTNRANERLNNTNPRVLGGFTPSQTNYVGIDFTRTVDDTTSDIVQFMDPDTLLETPKTVPLARTIDYRIVISTTDFAALPGICPIAKVVTDSGNQIVTVTDARNLFFRSGSGGSTPNPLAKYTFPAGRKENTSGEVFSGGDKAITNLKTWCDAVMTRIWELGGGERWTTPTADRNLRLVHTGAAFVSTGEYFEWDGTNAHWQGLKVLFDNSTGSFNAIANQTTNLAGLTDLADGECLYVDLDRTQNLSGGSSLIAQKAPLVTLGPSAIPGARVVFAWRSGSQLFTRDQGFAVNSSFKVATIAALGTVQLSATGLPTPGAPIVATVAGSGNRQAIAGGITRGGADFIGGSGALRIGGGTLDHDVQIRTVRSQDPVTVSGIQDFLLNSHATLEVINQCATLGTKNQIFSGQAYNDGTTNNETAITVESIGAVGYRNVTTRPADPTPGSGRDATIRHKEFYRTNGLSTPDTRDQKCIMWFDGSITVIAEGPAY